MNRAANTNNSVASRGGVTTFETLGDPSFRRLWVSSWCYYVARLAELAVLMWLVLQLTNSPFRVALVGVGRTVPMFLLGLFVGAMADRLPPRRMLLMAHGLHTLSTATMALVIALGLMQYWFAYVVVFSTGLVWATDFTARRLVVLQVVGGNRLLNALSLDAAVQNGSNMLGPLLAGTLISLGGFTAAYAAVAALYFAGFLVILTLRVPSIPPVEVRSANPVIQVVETLRAVRSNTTILAAILVTVCVNVFAMPFQQMVPVVAKNVLGANAFLYGVLGSSVGVGAIVGSLLIATARFRRHGAVYILGSALILASVIVFAFSHIYSLSVALLLGAGIGLSFFAIMQPLIVMEASSPETRGRALGSVALGIGSQPLGLLMVGWLAERFSPQTALVSVASVGLVVLATLRWRFPSLRDKPVA